MARKHWILLALAVLLGGLSLYFNSDWFRGDDIQIYHRIRPARAGWAPRKRAAEAAGPAIFFGFDRKLSFTELKVVACSDFATNKFPHALWHMLSDSNSVATKGFVYGENVPGMRPAIKGAVPEPLEPNTKYRLLIQASSFKGQHDFTPLPQAN